MNDFFKKILSLSIYLGFKCFSTKAFLKTFFIKDIFKHTKNWQKSMMNLHHLVSVLTVFYQICFTYVSSIPSPQEYIKANLKYHIMSTIKTSEYIASKYGLLKNITIWLSYIIRLVFFNIA